jgi:hypothetical protein
LTESGIDHYEVQRSENGREFNNAGNVNARLNNYSEAAYSWIDTRPVMNVAFYRVKIVGTDGNVNYGNVVKVTDETQAELIVYPNPVSDGTLNLNASGLKRGTYQIQVYDIVGKSILSRMLPHDGGVFTQPVELPANLTPGIYRLSITGDNYKSVKSFIKQK